MPHDSFLEPFPSAPSHYDRLLLIRESMINMTSRTRAYSTAQRVDREESTGFVPSAGLSRFG